MNALIYKLSEINNKNKQCIVDKLNDYIVSKGFEVGEGQIVAWEACLDFLINQYTIISNKDIDSDVVCIFEYSLALEGGRRPDVIMLFKEKVVILEFKNKESYTEDDVLQAIGYREDIYNYHGYVRDNDIDVESYLVLTKGNASSIENGLKVLNRHNFINKIGFDSLSNVDVSEGETFIDSPYEPLPDILSATYNLFKEGKLPYIQNIEDGDIEKAYKTLQKIVLNNMRTNHGKNIVFISGVPGAGKTLVALKFLYNYNKYIKANSPNQGGAIYLSGNGPLVNVLEAQIDDALGKTGQGKAYIKSAIKFKYEFMNNNKVPNYNVVLFDEAQRAWDEKKMGPNKGSEPKVLLDICNKMYKSKKNVTLVCFVGNGQSIHEGEEKGIELWVDALKQNGGYNIYLPDKFSDEFRGVTGTNIVKDLHLDTSIRNNFIDISRFVEAILDCDIEECKKELDHIKSKGFVIKVSRDIDKCKSYVSRLEDHRAKYGMLISSKADEYYMKKVLNDNRFTSYIESKDAGKWFLEECTKFRVAASEFACQGLEIDFPIVIFGGDYYIDNGKFRFDRDKLKKKLDKYDNPDVIMESIYRVLLTRSRKGMLLFVPDDRMLDETYEFLKYIGIEEIEIMS